MLGELIGVLARMGGEALGLPGSEQWKRDQFVKNFETVKKVMQPGERPKDYVPNSISPPAGAEIAGYLGSGFTKPDQYSGNEMVNSLITDTQNKKTSQAQEVYDQRAKMINSLFPNLVSYNKGGGLQQMALEQFTAPKKPVGKKATMRVQGKKYDGTIVGGEFIPYTPPPDEPGYQAVDPEYGIYTVKGKEGERSLKLNKKTGEEEYIEGVKPYPKDKNATKPEEVQRNMIADLYKVFGDFDGTVTPAQVFEIANYAAQEYAQHPEDYNGAIYRASQKVLGAEPEGKDAGYWEKFQWVLSKLPKPDAIIPGRYDPVGEVIKEKLGLGGSADEKRPLDDFFR